MLSYVRNAKMRCVCVSVWWNFAKNSWFLFDVPRLRNIHFAQFWILCVHLLPRFLSCSSSSLAPSPLWLPLTFLFTRCFFFALSQFIHSNRIHSWPQVNFPIDSFVSFTRSFRSGYHLNRCAFRKCVPASDFICRFSSYVE